MRNTKIICTLGPATESEKMLRAMVDAGTNVFRLNMSHASHEWVRAIVPRIRKVASDLDAVVAILMDTQGPAIRTGDLPNKLDLKPGDIIEFTVRGERSEEQYSVDVNYDGLVDDISVGDTVLVDNGVMHMEVLDKENKRVRCRVLTAGTLGSRRHINLPGVKVNLPPLTSKDLEDVALGSELEVDMVALSFCREPSDVDALRAILCQHGSKARIVAKIEDQLAVRNIGGIIDKADIIMVARGDLGIECAMEELPIIQRAIVKRCLRVGRPVIVATHMLESMISNPVPTRAEVTDVANAVYEQADGIMLSGETSVGKYPIECVMALDRVASRIERSGGAGYANEAQYRENRQRTMHSAVVLANSLRNSKLVVFTRRGRVADYVSAQRPEHSPIFAFSNTLEVCRKIVLNWGIYPILMPFEHDPEQTIENATQLLRKRGLVHHGDNLVIVSDLQAGESTFDSIQHRPVI
ncbi:MAG: pyruvate kinase [Verrucomicrobiota bacterium]